MTRWAAGTPEHFLIHMRGMIHAIKEMELHTKFQEATKAFKSVTLEVNLGKMTNKDKLKKREKDNASQQAARAGKAAPDKVEKLKKAEGEESPHAMVIVAKAALDKAGKARNEVHE